MLSQNVVKLHRKLATGRILVAVVGALAAVLAVVPQPACAQDLERAPGCYISGGINAFEKSDLDLAEREFRGALKAFPGFAEARENLVITLARKGQLDEAVGEFATMLANRPHWAEAHDQKLEQIDPDSAIGNFLMARYWFRQKEYARARLYAERVRASRPDNSELRALLGDIYLQLGEKQKACREYEEAIHLAPERADWRERLRTIAGEGLHPDGNSQP